MFTCYMLTFRLSLVNLRNSFTEQHSLYKVSSSYNMTTSVVKTDCFAVMSKEV